MTHRPLTDDQLAAGLRAHLPVPDAALRERILAASTTTPQDRRLPSILGRMTDADPVVRRRTLLLVALLALAISISAVAVAGALLRDRSDRDLSVVPPVDRPSAVPSPTRTLSQVVNGWPDTTENAAGLYSWDGSACGASTAASCTVGFMHNGYGSGDVSITIQALAVDPSSAGGAVAATVAGHDGFYRRVSDELEVWIADLEGTTIRIGLEARPGTSAADLAEAYAIIDSMRTEPRDNVYGFRLVFTLLTDDWDSG